MKKTRLADQFTTRESGRTKVNADKISHSTRPKTPRKAKSAKISTGNNLSSGGAL